MTAKTKVAKEPVDLEAQVRLIRLKTLGLCQLIADACPKNARLEQALGSIRAGARIALEEITYLQERERGPNA